MSRAERIAKGLGGAKKTPDGYICRCPCHEDKSASLSLKETDKGIILNCFAGCHWEDIKKEVIRLGLLDTTPKVQRKSKYDGATFYYYKDLAGATLCRKVKTLDKKMWIERVEGNGWVAGLNGMTVPLYNLRAVIDSDIVYLCEGEKDAETLISRGFCATTNHSGANGWAPHFTEQLKGKTVIIIPDNDDAGKKRITKVSRELSGHVKELRVFIPDGVPEKGDITDWINNGGDPSTIFTRSTVVEKQKAAQKAPRTDYFKLFDEVLNSPKKCIFNEKLMHYEERSRLWNPAINALEIIKSHALVENETREAKFVIDNIKPHFFAYEALKDPEFLIEIPDWDGEQRIEAMCNLITLNPDQGISESSLAELVKEWCSLMFQRLHNPMIQNRILILQGGQGIGKDTWISMLLDGLGQFCVPWANVKDDKDTYLQLHKGLVMKIPEFDKTRNAETSTLKDIITTPSTDIRAPYQTDSKIRRSRCSFISSTNPKNILRDSTGNRRFLIFEIETIEYAYSGWTDEQIHDWQMQCLAEMVQLAKDKYKASPKAWSEINEYIQNETPSDYSLEITTQFINYYRMDQTLGPQEFDISPDDTRITDLVSKLAKQNSLRFKAVKSMIQSRLGVYKRAGARRFKAWRIPAREGFEIPAMEDEQPSLPWNNAM